MSAGILDLVDRIAAACGAGTTSRSMVSEFGQPPHIQHADVIGSMALTEWMLLGDEEHLWQFVATRRIAAAQETRIEEGATR